MIILIFNSTKLLSNEEARSPKSMKDVEITIYIGTRNIVAMIGRITDEAHFAKHVLVENPAGFKRGSVINLDRASSTLDALMSDLFTDLGQEFPKWHSSANVSVVFGHSQLKTYTFSSSQYFQGSRKNIAPHDIRSVVDQTRSVATLPLSEFVLQVIPVSFVVNDLEDVRDPIGLEAQRLGVTVKIFSMPFEIFKNLSRAFELSEIEVKGFFPKTLTASEAVLHKKEKDEGVFLIDVDYDSTFVTHWRQGELIDSRILEMGDRHLSKALAKAWEMDAQDAERVIDRFGAFKLQTQFESELIPLIFRNGEKNHTIKRADFHASFLKHSRSCLEEIMKAVRQFVRDENFYHPHYVFTGVGARYDGFLEFIHKEFSVQGRMGQTRLMDAPHELLVNPALTASLGMFSWLAGEEEENSRLLTPRGIFRNTFAQAKNWFAAYF